ncbi:MAG: putative PEP-binding protein, partial [bacterium]
QKNGVEFNEETELGIMIEVPSAAILARHLAQYVKFFSIGTNDLIQYTLAVDRGNQNVADLYQSYNPAVLRLIKETVVAARMSNIWTGVCGELAGDPRATILLLGLGIDEFSCVPQNVPLVKSIIRSIKYTDAQSIADEILQCESQFEVLEILKKAYNELIPKDIAGIVGIANQI